MSVQAGMFVHIPIAICIQLVCCLIGRRLYAPLTASLWIGGFAGSAVCVMREITQREYQWIEAYGHGLRANMPGYEGLKVWEWNAHSIDETVIAIIAAGIVAVAGTWWVGERDGQA